MTDVELRITTDLDQATKELAGFSKEYAQFAKQVEKPLRQVNATRELESNLEATGKQVRQARQRLQELQRELINTDYPTTQLKESFREATKELQKLERVEATQASQLSRMRSELKGAGVDTTRLAQEQRRLNSELTNVMGAGRQDAAARGIRDRAAALKQQAVAQRQANLEAARNNLGVTQSRGARLEIQSLRQQFELLRASGALTTKELAVAQRELKRRIRETKDELRGLEGGFGGGGGGGGIAGNLRGGGAAAAVAAGVAAVGAGAVQVAQGADEVGRLDARLRLATKSQQEFNNAQAELDRIADATQSDITGLVDLYSRLQRPLSEVGMGQKETLQTVEAVSLALKIGGTSAAEADGAVRQLSQALASGVLRGDEFNSVLEQSDRVAGALADELGVTVGQLRQLAKDGKLTTETIVKAFGNQLPKLREEYSKFAPELGAAFDRLLTETKRYWGRQAKESGITDSLASTINEMAKNTNRVEQLQKESYGYREGLFAMHAAEMKALRQGDLKDLEESLDKQVQATKTKLAEQVKAERKAASELESAKKAQLETQQRYQEALAKVNGGVAGDPSYASATALKVSARNALQAGDVEGAKRQAQAALAVIEQLAAAGENTFGFGGFIKELQAIEQAADQQGIDSAQQKLEEAKKAAAATKAALEELKDVKVSATLSPEDEQKLLDQLQALAEKAGIILTIPVTPVMPEPGELDSEGYAYVPNNPPPPQFATGGYTGPGGVYEPAGVVHRGEVVWSQRDIARAGGVAVVEAMRRGMRGYSMGGIVAEPRLTPSIPAISPSLMQQADPMSGLRDWGKATLATPGGDVEVLMREDSFARLLRKESTRRGSPRRN